MRFSLADIYISVVSHSNCVAPSNKFLALASTTVETDDPETELAPAFTLLGNIDKKILFVSDLYEPNNDGTANRVR